MKILYLALGYPNVKKSTNIYTDLIAEFHKNGNEVLVVAPVRIDELELGLRKEGDINVLRVKTMNLFNRSAVHKGIANLLLPFQYIKALRKHVSNFDFDLIVMPTPPITLIGVVKWLRKKTDAKVYLILRDIFPQNAVDLKIMSENSFIHKFFRSKEKELYAVVDSIGCMSNANIEYVKEHNPKMEFSKLHLLPNWENLPNSNGEVNANEIKRSYGIENKFVIIFGGNIGKPQKMENIVALAKECSSISDIVFLIIGKGTEMNRLKNKIATENIQNVILRGHIPRRDYNSLLRIADVGLISLSQDFTIPNFPSKVLSYYGLKIPVLASLDLSTDFGHVLESINAGVWAEAGKTQELKEKLLLLYNDKTLRGEMGQNGHDFMKDNLLPSHAYSIIIDHV